MRDVDRLNRQLKALLAAAVAGLAILALVQYIILPRIAREVSASQRIWLRNAFISHPAWLLFGIVALVAMISLPVLALALWMLRRRV
jgi:hypothetical protein